MSMTASTPIYRGYLSDVDCRWDAISASVDDRTDCERGVLTGADRVFIPKSRYASISRFISTDQRLLPEYNDLVVPFNRKCYAQLVEAGTRLFIPAY